MLLSASIAVILAASKHVGIEPNYSSVVRLRLRGRIPAQGHIVLAGRTWIVDLRRDERGHFHGEHVRSARGGRAHLRLIRNDNDGGRK